MNYDDLESENLALHELVQELRLRLDGASQYTTELIAAHKEVAESKNQVIDHLLSSASYAVQRLEVIRSVLTSSDPSMKERHDMVERMLARLIDAVREDTRGQF